MNIIEVPLSQEEMEQYAAQLCLPEVGAQGQQMLKSARVAVVGAGGLGCPALQYLAGAGIGELVVIDHDRITLSNLPRQILYGPRDLGLPKAQAAAAWLSEMNPRASIKAVVDTLTQANATGLLEGCQVVLDATDNAAARYAINDACAALNIPFVYGAIDRHQGQVAVFNKGTQGIDYRDLFPEPSFPMQMTTCGMGGIIGALGGIVGSIQAMECIKLLLKMPSLEGKLLVLDAIKWRVRVFEHRGER